MQRDYETLKLKPGATFQEVKKAYKKQAMEWHPDRFPGDDEKLQKKATRMFHQVTEAFQRLEIWHNNQSEGRYAEEQPDYSRYYGDRGPSGGGWADRTSEEVPQFITRTWKNGDKYEGMGINQQMHGQGLFTFANGNIYQGQFRFGLMEGQGKFQFANGDCYTGGFRENQFSGRGKFDFANGDRYMGHFAKDQFHGEGVLIADGQVHGGMWEYGSLMSERPF